jgi:hypothetical protein
MSLEKKIKNKIFSRITPLLIFPIFFFGYHQAHAATLRISANTTTVAPGDTVTLSVVLNSEGVAVNDAGATIQFPAALFNVISINKSNSVLPLWVEDPSFSNTDGTITFEGGIPTPGYIGSQGSVVLVTLQAIGVGQANFAFSDATVRANDGLGTDVLDGQQGVSITIAQKNQPVQTPVAPVVASPTIPSTALQIASSTNPDQGAWYKDASPVFSWNLPSGTNGIRTSIGKNASDTVTSSYIPAITTKTLKDLADGIWYFKVRPRINGVWGTVSSYTAQIDSTVPQQKDVAFAYDSVRKVLTISTDASDATSGLDHFDLYINNALIKSISNAEFVNGSYVLALQAYGNNMVKLIAFDRAGNSVESAGSFLAPFAPVNSPELPLSPLLLALLVPTNDILIFVAVMLFIVLGLLLVRHPEVFEKDRSQRTVVANGATLKMLMTMKKRLEKHLEILQDIRHTRILTKVEKEIKEAIEGDLDEVDKAIEKQKK